MLCSNCVLPESYPGIQLDDQHVCNFCRAHEKERCPGPEALDRELRNHARGSETPACVVPISGGKDSTYVLYYVTKVLGLNAVAVNYDNGLAHDQAKDNLRRTTDTLGVELVIIRGAKQTKLLKGNLRSFLARPVPSMVPLMCTGCRIGIVGSACKVARDRNIGLVVMGWSRMEDTPFKAALLSADGGSVVGGLAVNLFRNPGYFVRGGIATQVLDYIHNYSRVREWGTILRTLHPGIRQLSLYDYVEYDPGRIQREVAEKVGWSCPDPDNSWQFDCQVKSLQNLLYRSLLGFTASSDYLSAKIREGYITRDQALEALENQKSRASKEMESVRALLSEIGAAELIPHLEKVISKSPHGPAWNLDS